RRERAQPRLDLGGELPEVVEQVPEIVEEEEQHLGAPLGLARVHKNPRPVRPVFDRVPLLAFLGAEEAQAPPKGLGEPQGELALDRVLRGEEALDQPDVPVKLVEALAQAGHALPHPPREQAVLERVQAGVGVACGSPARGDGLLHVGPARRLPLGSRPVDQLFGRRPRLPQVRVAQVMASTGVNPASTINCNSRCSKYPWKRRGGPESVPKATLTPSLNMVLRFSLAMANAACSCGRSGLARALSRKVWLVMVER